MKHFLLILVGLAMVTTACAHMADPLAPTATAARVVSPTQAVSPSTATATPMVSATPLSTPTASPTRAWPPDVVHIGAPWADFALRFDPSQWEVKPFRDDLPGLEILVHRSLPGCQITPNIPVGLGDDWTSKGGQQALGSLTLSTRSFFKQGEIKFVAYYGFLAAPYEGGVEVHLPANGEACLWAAEAQFATAKVVRLNPTP